MVASIPRENESTVMRKIATAIPVNRANNNGCFGFNTCKAVIRATIPNVIRKPPLPTGSDISDAKRKQKN